MNVIIRSVVHLLEPVGFVWLMLLIVTLWLARRKQWRIAIFTALTAAFMSVIGSTALPGWMLSSLEQPYVRTDKLAEIPPADAIVMLGGGAQPSRYDAFRLDLTTAGDRAFMTLELARLRKAKTVVLGGAVHTTPSGRHIEADLMKTWFDEWKLSDAAVISLGACENTREEAEKVAALAQTNGWKRVLLVTSAYHMRRASATFLTAGVTVDCVPCDFQTTVSIETTPGWTLVPRWQGFMKTAVYLHEQIGWYAYQRRGWIKADAAK